MTSKVPTQLSLADLECDERHEQFLDKFKTHKTTDDCLTPPEIYAVVLTYVVKRYGIDPLKVVRPFWPGRDYTREEYEDGCTVVDNPPFSILQQIVKHYLDAGVNFFLFAPTLTALSGRQTVMRINHIICHSQITYANGARVPTSFVTNLDTDGTVLESDPTLSNAINDKDNELQKAGKVHHPRYVYPDHVIHAARCQYFAAHDTPYKLNARDCTPISKLDAMDGKTIFGGGLLLSERAAAERAAAERAAARVWELSERERELVRLLSNGQNDD